MPRLGGLDAYHRLACHADCPPVLFVSGFVGDADLHAVLKGRNQFLAKPFGECALLRAVNRCLAPSETDAAPEVDKKPTSQPREGPTPHRDNESAAR